MWPENQWQMEDLYKFLRFPQKWGKRLKVWHSRLAAVRSARSPVGEPIAATSDDAALFLGRTEREGAYLAGLSMAGRASRPAAAPSPKIWTSPTI